MSKKTATKKSAKKPDPKAAGERALNLRKIAMEEEAMRIRRIVSKMLEPVHKRLTALECTCGLSAHLSKLLEPFTP